MLLNKAHLSLDDKDALIWAPHKTGQFSVKSLCLELAKCENPAEQVIIKGIWRGLVPPRIELFTWLAILGKINSRVKLAHIGVIHQDETTCVLCNLMAESHDHLLLHCQYSWQIWAWWLNIWSIKWTFPKSLKEAFEQWICRSKGIFFQENLDGKLLHHCVDNLEGTKCPNFPTHFSLPPTTPRPHASSAQLVDKRVGRPFPILLR